MWALQPGGALLKTVDSTDVPTTGILAPSEGTEVIRADIGWLWRRDDGIVVLKPIDELEMTLAMARELFAVYAQLGRGERVRVLFEVGSTRRGSTAAREYMAGPEAAKAHVAAAHLVASPVARVLISSFMRLQRPSYPTRVFPARDVEAAVTWLKACREGGGS